MNVHNFKRLMSAIETAPEGTIYMQDWHRDTSCGTAHCIAGWCEVITHGEAGVSEHNAITVERAQAFLGIDEIDSLQLFGLDGWPEHLEKKYYRQPREATLERLKLFVETEGRE